jgi:flavorubredoxin
MQTRSLTKNVYAVGANDWHRTVFDALFPLPYGTSYNSYFIMGNKKNALIDTVDPSKFDILKANLDYLEIDHIDYIISNHAEQDHSGSIPEVMKQFPEAFLVINKKGKDMLLPLMDIPENRIQLVEDREVIQLGDKKLEFIFAPWVHWPETMFTYLREDKILFSCDLFGAHLASDQLLASENDNTLQEAKKYYAEIMMPYSGRISKHLETLQSYDIRLIAPSHGPVLDHPLEFMEGYQDWISDRVKNEVVILYITMHGSTEAMANYLEESLMQKNISVRSFNLVSADIGDIALSLVDAATIIFASPAVLMGPHPKITYTAYLINSLKPKTKYIGIIGSFGWGNKLVAQVTEMLKDLNSEFLSPVLVKGFPRKENFEELGRFAEEIINRHSALSK